MMRQLAGCRFLPLLVLPLPAAAQPDSINWRSYTQLAGERDSGGDVDFEAERFRVRAEAAADRFSGVVQLELAADQWSRRRPGTAVDVIMDAYMNYRVNERLQLRAGQFKTPIGLDFSLSPHVMEIAKRGMEFALVLNRASGVMLSGRRFGRGFGYDAGVFNLAGRSLATDYRDDQEGDEYAYAVRGYFAAQDWRVEIAHGQSGDAGGPATADYRVSDVAWMFDRDRYIAKFEWIKGNGVRGDAARQERIYYLHGGYRIRDQFELVARHFDGSSRIAGAGTGLRNTFLGITWNAFDGESLDGRLQVNYVIAGGDESAYTGLRGFRDDTLLAQFQFVFTR